MSYKPRESDGLNLKELIKAAGNNPEPSSQSAFERNLVKALYNLNRRIDSDSGGDMTKAVYDPTNVSGDAFDMAEMVEAANAKVMTGAERTLLAELNLPEINTQTGTTYTLVIGDHLATVEMNNALANVVTIPLNSSVAFAIKSRLDIVQIGAGLTTIRGAVGVTINGNAEAGGDESDVDAQGQWKALSLYKRGTDEWVVIGGA
jgi:hypothetical protein